MTVQLDSAGDGSISAQDDVDNGSSDACGIDTYVLDQTALDCSDVGSLTVVTMTVTDVNGNTAVGSTDVTVEYGVDPTARCVADGTAAAPRGYLPCNGKHKEGCQGRNRSTQT